MVEQAPPWPKNGPASYFPSIEKKHGRSIAEWQQIIASCGLEKHMAIVGYLKSGHGMGHGHANALVRWTLAGNVASPSSCVGASPRHRSGEISRRRDEIPGLKGGRIVRETAGRGGRT
jgi:hypothetical protein